MSDSVVSPPMDASPTEELAPNVNRRAAMTFGVALLVMFGIGVVLAFVRIPYLVLQPGSTFETESYIEVDGTGLYPNPDGEVSFVTVTQRRLSPVGWLIARTRASNEIFHEDVLLRGRTLDEQREENAQLMLSSQNESIAAALAQLGFQTSEPGGVVVVDVAEGGPVDGLLARNDVITSVDGVLITTIDELFERLNGLEEGASVTFVAGRPGEEAKEIVVELTDDTRGFLGVAGGNDDGTGAGALIDDVVPGGPVENLLGPGSRITGLNGSDVTNFDDLVAALADQRSGDVVSLRAVLGDGTAVEADVTLAPRAFERAGLANAATQFRDAALPFDVAITTENIGGPSAGLAFTLTVIDVLTEGDLTGGNEIVVTGTILRDGRVGPIGGVHQKAFAAKDGGADVFIVPAENLDEATAAVDDLRIEGVETLADALEIIEDMGGNVSELPTDGTL